VLFFHHFYAKRRSIAAIHQRYPAGVHDRSTGPAPHLPPVAFLVHQGAIELNDWDTRGGYGNELTLVMDYILDLASGDMVQIHYMEFFVGWNIIDLNGEYSSKPCLITRGYIIWQSLVESGGI